MVKFLKNLISSSDDTSHKRVIACFAAIVLFVMCILSSFGHTADDTAFIVITVIVLGQSGLTVLRALIKQSPNKVLQSLVDDADKTQQDKNQ
jgi:hypothetical protein